MYRIVWIFVVWSIAVSLSYFFDFWPLSFIAFGGVVLALGLTKCHNNEHESNVEVGTLFCLPVGTVLYALIELETSYIYSIVVSSVYLVGYLLYLGGCACKTNDQLKVVFTKKLRNATIVKALSATTLLVTSIIVAYTTELYSLIPSGLLPVCVIYIQTGFKCCKSCVPSIKSFTPNKVRYQMSNQEQEHLFGINAL